MKSERFGGVAKVLALSLSLAPLASQDSRPSGRPSAHLGYWQSTTKKDHVLRLEPHRLTRREGKEFEAFLVRIEPRQLVLNFSGHPLGWRFAVDGGQLRLTSGTRKGVKTETFRRLGTPPADFEPSPLKLGKARARSSQIKGIRKELQRRERKDQQARRRCFEYFFGSGITAS